MSRAHSLFRLQEIDLALDANNARIEEIRKILGESEELTRAKSFLTQASETLRKIQIKLKNSEQDVDTQRMKIEETENKLYGGSIKNPKELQDLQNEVDALKRHAGTLEDRLLDVMVEFEQSELDYETAKKNVETIEKAREVTFGELNIEQQNLMEENERLNVNREAALVGISAEDVKLYEQIRQKQGGIAIAILEKDGSCSICGLSPSAAQQQIIRSGTQLQQCNQCRRILYSG